MKLPGERAIPDIDGPIGKATSCSLEEWPATVRDPKRVRNAWVTYPVVAFVIGLAACGYPPLPGLGLGGGSDAPSGDAPSDDAQSSDAPSSGCADGNVEQVFTKGMVGCAGSVTFANRATLCSSGYQPASSSQWVANRGVAAPMHDYWTNDALKYNGSGTSACFVSTTVGTDCSAGTSMRVCTAAGTDVEGNTCDWTHCGINANTPDQFFGGCGGNTAGTVCIPAGGTAGSVFSPRFPVTERHGTQGASTAGSFAAAAMMGAQGYSNVSIPANWETMITDACTAHTGTSPWPARCTPAGMAAAVTAFTSNDWETRTWADQASALNETVASLQFYQSPAVVPIYGQADHWVAVTQITATSTGPGTWSITVVKGFDGGPVGGTDSGASSYIAGLQAWSGTVWRNIYYLGITSINPSCDGAPGGCGAPPNNDPYFGKYVLMYEPPVGQRHPPTSTVFEKPPGIVPAGTNGMNERVAQIHVWDALTSAGIDRDPETWSALAGGVPGAGFHVDSVWPDGSPWTYYLVPILSSANTALAFVQLAGDDGAFEAINVPTNPVPFAPVSMMNARQLAAGVLSKGESLRGGMLTWDARPKAHIIKSPIRPYYEFGVVSASKRDAGVIRVTLDKGTVVRSQ